MGLIVTTANFYLTDAGKAAALDAANNSINIEVTKIAIGTAKYDAQVTAPTQTALTTEVGRYNLVGGGSSGQVLRLTTTLTPNYTAEIFEIGLFLSDGTLFAVAAVTGTDPLMQTANGLTSVITLGCSLADIGSNVTVSVDANSPIAVVLMNQHIEHSDPHPQYVRHSDKASTTQAGIVQLDNQDFGELISSTNETKAVTPKQLGETNKLVAQRIFFGQTSTDIVQSDNSNTFIRIFGGDGIVGGSTQIKGSGNVAVSTDSEGIGYLNIHGALNNSLTSTATNEALSANQGRVLNDQAFGVGQTWQNVTSSRSLGTTYTNSTGRSIEVSISLPDTVSQNPTVTINVGGVDILINNYDLGDGVGSFSHSFVVPVGATYRISVDIPVQITLWAELR